MHKEVANLHDLLVALHWVPYQEAKHLLGLAGGREGQGNIGSVTGLFFELAVVSIVRPYISRELPRSIMALNWAVEGLDQSLPPRPDISVRNGDHFAVVEIKVSPKKRDLQRAIQLEKAHRGAHTGYYLIGGSLSANFDMLVSFKDREWACFAWAPDHHKAALRELPTLDSVLANMVLSLKGS